jgi:hypothetical protein
MGSCESPDDAAAAVALVSCNATDCACFTAMTLTHVHACVATSTDRALTCCLAMSPLLRSQIQAADHARLRGVHDVQSQRCPQAQCQSKPYVWRCRQCLQAHASDVTPSRCTPSQGSFRQASLPWKALSHLAMISCRDAWDHMSSTTRLPLTRRCCWTQSMAACLLCD